MSIQLKDTLFAQCFNLCRSFFGSKSICSAYVKRNINKKTKCGTRTQWNVECPLKCTMDFECAKFVGLIVLSFFCWLAICCGNGSKWRRAEKSQRERDGDRKSRRKNCQCEVGAYVIFGLLIYSVLKWVSRDVCTNKSMFLSAYYSSLHFVFSFRFFHAKNQHNAGVLNFFCLYSFEHRKYMSAEHEKMKKWTKRSTSKRPIMRNKTWMKRIFFYSSFMKNGHILSIRFLFNIHFPNGIRD